METASLRALATRPFRLSHYLKTSGDFRHLQRHSVMLQLDMSNVKRPILSPVIALPGGKWIVGLAWDYGSASSSREIHLVFWDTALEGSPIESEAKPLVFRCRIDRPKEPNLRLVYRESEDDYLLLIYDNRHTV